MCPAISVWERLILMTRRSVMGQFVFLSLSNNPRSLCDSLLGSVYFSFLKRRVKIIYVTETIQETRSLCESLLQS